MAREDNKSTGGKAKKPRKERFEQYRQVFRMARQLQPRIGWYMLAIVAAALLLGFGIGYALGHPYYVMFVAAPIGVLLATLLLSRTAERSAYASIEGQPGAGGALLQSLKRGWAIELEPIAIEGGRAMNMTDAALVYRAVGRPGVVLVGEGPRGRASRLLAQEVKRTGRLVPNVPVHTFRLGTDDGPDAVAARDLLKGMGKLKNTLTKHEVAEVNRRLHALGRARAPIPAGVDPQRIRSLGKGQRR